VAEPVEYKRDKASRKRSTKWFLVLALIGICGCGAMLVLPAVLLPLLAQRRFPTRQVDCLSNIKKTAAGQLLYAADFDGILTPKERWVEVSMAYVNSPSDFQCPQVKTSSFAFALNEFVAGETLSTIKNPAKTVMLFEPKDAKINASGYPVTDSARPPRHSGKNNVAMMDGSAQAAKP
jgi:prepilin-type processing-associated H-X9-DG protein